jgi:hypothetical protein
MTSIGQLLKELKKRELLNNEAEKAKKLSSFNDSLKLVNPLVFSMEESMKKRLQRNMYKCQREF